MPAPHMIPVLSTFVIRLRAGFCARRSLRNLLLRKDDHLLRDIGLDPAEARAVLDGAPAPWMGGAETPGPVTRRVLPCDMA